MQEQHLTKKERKALRREERRQESQKANRKSKVMTIFFWVVGLAVLGLLLYGGYTLLTAQKESLGEDFSIAVPIMDSRGHVNPGSPRPNYNSNPPTSGPHGSTINKGVHDEEFPDESLVHNLEHGVVWVSYQPDIPEEVVNELEDITKSHGKVVLTIRSANEKDIALSAWGRLDTFDVNPDGTIDKARIEDFIKRYRNKAPERVP